MDVKALLDTKGTDVAMVPPDATVTTAVDKLQEAGIGALVVSSDGSVIVGIVSERDVVRGIAKHGAALLDMSVDSIMTAEVRTCDLGANIRDIMSEMTTSRIRHLPVVENKQLRGIISIGDVVKNRLEELETETNTLRDFIVGRS